MFILVPAREGREAWFQVAEKITSPGALSRGGRVVERAGQKGVDREGWTDRTRQTDRTGQTDRTEQMGLDRQDRAENAGQTRRRKVERCDDAGGVDHLLSSPEDSVRYWVTSCHDCRSFPVQSFGRTVVLRLAGSGWTSVRLTT